MTKTENGSSGRQNLDKELEGIEPESISVAAHQLRIPLTRITWIFQTLLDKKMGSLDPDQEKIVRDGLEVTLNAVDLVNDLLNITRIETGQFRFVFHNQAVSPVIEKAFTHLKSTATKKGVSLTLNILPHLPNIFIDAEKMGIALENLLDNAIKYTKPGGEITIQAQKEENKIKVDIIDTGIGIPKSDQHRLFSKFFRADNAILSQPSGTGLGLYLVKNIIEEHGGTIIIESGENKGTKVTFTLPIAENNTEDKGENKKKEEG